MPIANMLINVASNHGIFTFMDGYSCYNQIFVAKVNIHETTFRCLGALGVFEWVVMPFELKNTRVTYQRAMNAIFHNLIGKNMEVYIDNVVVKSVDVS